MNTSADELAGDTPPEPPTLEERLTGWIRLVSEIVAVLWMIDIATKGEASEQIKFRFRKWRARHDQNRRLRIATNHALWEARRIVESEGGKR